MDAFILLFFFVALLIFGGTLLILIFLLLGGTFVKINNFLKYLIPTHFANEISSFIVTEGKGLFFATPYIGVLIGFCTFSLIIALLVFKLKKFEDIL